jgi:hypothetical protein
LAEVEAGGAPVTLWLGRAADPARLEEGLMARLAYRLKDRGTPLSLVVPAMWLDALDPAAKLALRDIARDWAATLRKGEAPHLANGAIALAEVGGSRCRRWASRDPAAALPGDNWGQAQLHPIVSLPSRSAPLSVAVDPASLLPKAGTRYIAIRRELDGPLAGFSQAFATMVLPAIREAGGKSALKAMTTMTATSRRHWLCGCWQMLWLPWLKGLPLGTKKSPCPL